MDANNSSTETQSEPGSGIRERPESPTDRSRPSGPSDPDDGTVLVVDDEPQLVGMYASMLEDAYTVYTATSGEAALDRFSEEIDVVLLDRRMPGVSGDDVLERIRAASPSCRVGMVTSVAPDVDVLEMPFDAYLVKPVRKRDLRDLVNGLIARTRYSEAVNELFSLSSRLVGLEAELSENELADNETYQSLLERRERLERLTHGEFEAVVDRDDVGLVYRDVVREAAGSTNR